MSEAEVTAAETKKWPRADVKRCVELLERIVSFMEARQRAVKSGLAPVPFLEGIGLNVIDAAGQFTVMVGRLGDAWLEAGMRPNPGLVRASDILDNILGRDTLPLHGGLTATDAEMRRLRSALERARGEWTGAAVDSKQRSGSGPRGARGGAVTRDSSAADPPPCPPPQGGREKIDGQTRMFPGGLPGCLRPQGGGKKQTAKGNASRRFRTRRRARSTAASVTKGSCRVRNSGLCSRKPRTGVGRIRMMFMSYVGPPSATFGTILD